MSSLALIKPTPRIPKREDRREKERCGRVRERWEMAQVGKREKKKVHRDGGKGIKRQENIAASNRVERRAKRNEKVDK